jgi:hypothetical protein
MRKFILTLMFAVLGTVFMSFTPEKVTEKGKTTTMESIPTLTSINVIARASVEEFLLQEAPPECPVTTDFQSREYVGTNFVKNTCTSGGPGHITTEYCYSYSPYANGGAGAWLSVSCWPE